MIAFLIAFISSILLARQGKIIESTIILFVSLIQLNEYFFWENNSCNKNNILLSMVTVIILTLQIYVFSAQSLRLNKQTEFNFYMFIVICVTLSILYEIYINKYCTVKESNSYRLKWAYTSCKLFYLYCILYLFQGYFSNISGPYNVMIPTLLIASFYGIYKKSNFTDIIGSMWCFFSVIYGPIKLLEL
jgi:hypothetical protein